MGTKITPEFILERFSGRLRGKSAELEFLFYLDKGFEKWLQYELVLSMREVTIPVVYDSSDKEIKKSYSDGTDEKICDITTEYTIEPTVRSDLIIAESPFISKFVDEEWRIQKEDDLERCKDEYAIAYWNYIELKHKAWVDLNTTKEIQNTIVSDLNKYYELDWRNFSQKYRPSTVSSLLCLHFWDKGEKSGDLSSDLNVVVETIGKGVCDKCDKKFGMKGSAIWEQIKNDVYLMAVYYKIRITSK